MRRFTTLLYTCFSLIFLVTACSEPEKPATREEAAALAKSLESSMAKHSAARFNEVLDAESLRNRIMEAGKKKIDSRIVDGAIKELKTGQLGTQITQSLGKDGTYQLVKQYEKDQKQHLIFRLYADSKLNYHDFEVIKKKDQVKIGDIFIYITGETLSATLAESAMLMSENLSSLSSVDKDHVANIKRIRQLINGQDYEQANRIYKSLPAILRQTKIFKMMYVQIASGLGNDEYLKAMTDYQQAYPDAPNMYLLMIDAYILKEQHEKALASVNQLDALINKDPFLDYYRGLIYKMMGNKEKQREHFELLDKNMPAFYEGTLELLVTYLDNKETDKAVALVNSRSSNYKKIPSDQRETLYLMYPDFKKKMDAE